MSNILAIDTYGSHRVKNPQTGQLVSAYKMGYTTATSAVLLALYNDHAQDVSSKRASYHYIQIDADVTVRHGHILLKITNDELAKVEVITRQVHRPAVYLWRDDAWLEFPNLRQSEYAPIIGRSGPNFNPTGMQIVSTTTGEVESAIAGITAEKTQHDPNKKPWWWIHGDTYPHRDLLKRWGCRWSKKRKAWYLIAETLPDAIQNLIDALNTEAEIVSDEPCSDEEASAILGVQIQAQTDTSDQPSRLFSLGETVYARHDLEAPDGKPIPTGTGGTITRLYNRNPTHGWSYDVDFADVGVGWFFERELTPLEPVAGIRITHGQVVPTATHQPLSDMAIKQALIDSGHQPEIIDEITIDAPSEEAKEKPSIRIIKPLLDVSDDDEPVAIITAIRQTKPSQLRVLHPSLPSNKRTRISIPQSPCGELTGSITGNVWCYGWAKHEDICVYVNMGGPRMAVEAIRAKLGKGDIVNCVPWDAPTVELTAGEDNTGMYSAFMQNIPEAKFTSLILCHELLVEPNYEGKSTTFLIYVSDQQAMTQLRYHVTKLVKAPVFAEWTSYLWQAGQNAMLVRPTRTGGDVKLYTVVLDVDAWTRLITGGLAKNIISLPIKPL